jgi:hypothetical protein
VACPVGHAGEGYRLVRDGSRPGKDGPRQLYRCIAADGTTHRFRGAAPAGEAEDETTAGARQRVVRCPRAGHRDSVVQSRGERTTSTGTWKRFTCVPVNDDRHSFQLLVTDPDKPPVLVPPADPPPCPEHPGSHVVRWGTYGRRSLRQRYRCLPAGEGSRPHQFTPALSREAVTPGEECTRCDELLSPHHGAVTAARHTPWPLMGVVQALNSLAAGKSYASVSLGLRAHREAARAHLRDKHGIAFDKAGEGALTGAGLGEASRQERRNAWRVAADLIEQYSPILFADVNAAAVAEARALRATNDMVLAARPGAALEQPLVYVIDEMPVWTRAADKGKRPSWFVLTVAEIRWKETDPFALPQRETRLRLARAFPRATADAWKLVFDELEVRPDVVVADRGSGLQAALAGYYGDSVGVVPSLFHIHANLRDALLRIDTAVFLDGKERVLIDPLREHLGRLTRDELARSSEAEVTAWWDELEQIISALPAPVAAVRAQRAIHLPRLVAALPILAAYPGMPASNASVENRIRNDLKPFLLNRAQRFGNGERTNRLLNLLICQHAGVFADLDSLALRLRRLNEAAGGWAPAPRQILDKQPRGAAKRYQSLKAHSVITKLAKDRGIPTSDEQLAATAPPTLSKRKPETIARLPIREWARSVGLPAGVTGPIKQAVRAAYDAAQDGASDADAVALYQRLEKERNERNDASRNQRWTAAREKQRRAELAPVRAWAAEQGIVLPRNQRIPSEVTALYEAAQAGQQLRPRPSKQPKRGTP